MYTVTQYISAAVHDGSIDPKVIIDRYEDIHKAHTIELSVDEEKIYQEAKKADSRDGIIRFIMIFPAIYIISALLKLIGDIYFDAGDFFEMVFPVLIIVSIAIFINQIYVNLYIKGLAAKENDVIPSEKQQNVIISGGFSPFTGYGIDLDSWSFTVNLKKPGGHSDTPSEIDITELLDSISRKVASNIHDAEITDKIFVNGKDIRNNKLFMESILSKPIVKLDPTIIENFIGKSDEDVRHYRVITIPMWNGQITLSVFLRFIIIGNQLFSEARYFLLLPLKENLMQLDKAFSSSGFSYYYRLIIISLLKSSYGWFSGVKLLLIWFGKVQEAISEAIFGDQENKIKRKDETYNYAHSNSLRENWATPKYQRYFQMADKDLNYKITQHSIINSIIDYLESKGISTEDIKETQTTILNSGVMVTGGTINANQMATGTGATLKNKVANAIPSKQ